MPSKAFKLAESIVSNPVMNDIVTNTTAVPATITTQIATSTDQGVSTVADLPDTGNNPGDIQLVEATNRLYVWNGSGWYNIALINTTPIWDSGGQPSASYILDRDSPQDATIITLAASDPEGLPISYSYITSGSMDSMATISQDSSLFTITPKTVSEVGEGVELTGGITFRASDGVNILPSVSSFTLSFIFEIENSRYTTLLATAVDTSDNNNITDSSTSNHTITVTGDAYAGTFSPYTRGGYGFQFDGSNQFVSIPHNSNVAWFGQGQFTIEFWVRLNEVGTNQQFFDFRPHPYSDPAVDVYRLGSDNKVYVRANGATRITSTTLLDTAGEWYHILVHRDSASNLKLFINGTQTGSTVTGYNQNFQAVASGNWSIGRTNSGASYVNGQITDFRVQHGEAITPPSGGPTERLTANSNTKFFYAGTPYVVDGSSNNYSITLNNGAKISPATPFDNLKYSATDHGGSIYFDGTDDALEISDNADFDLSGGSWTIECWWYPLVVNTYNGIFNQWNGASVASGRNINVSWESDRLYLFGYDGGTFISSIYHDVTAAQLQNRWNHVAAVFDGTKTELYLNGEASGRAYVSSNNLSKDVASEPFRVAKTHRLTSYYYNNSYVSDLRLVKGTAVYTGAFTPPSGPLTTTGGTYPSTTNVNTSITASHTKLFLKGTDASIIDKSQVSNLKLVGNTTGSTTQVKFANTKSMYFDGTGDSVFVPYESIPSFGIIEFTIEGWIYMNNLTGNQLIVDKWVSGNSQGFQFYHRSTGSSLTFYVGSTIVVQDPSSSSISAQTWHHVAVTRDSSANVRLYVDGLKKAQSTSNVSFDSTIDLYLGVQGSALNNYFNGYMQDVRLSNKALYTADDESSNIPSAPLKG